MPLRVRAVRTADVPAILAINKRGRPGGEFAQPRRRRGDGAIG
jgi:hypothetical protein